MQGQAPGAHLEGLTVQGQAPGACHGDQGALRAGSQSALSHSGATVCQPLEVNPAAPHAGRSRYHLDLARARVGEGCLII